MGLDLTDGKLRVDLQELLGLEALPLLSLEEVKTDDWADAFLVDQSAFEHLQHSFDHYLADYGDLDFPIETVNDFVQSVLAMQLETNTSFPIDCSLALLDSSEISAGSTDFLYGLLLDQQYLFAYDGQRIHRFDAFSYDQGRYTLKEKAS